MQAIDALGNAAGDASAELDHGRAIGFDYTAMAATMAHALKPNLRLAQGELQDNGKVNKTGRDDLQHEASFHARLCHAHCRRDREAIRDIDSPRR